MIKAFLLCGIAAAFMLGAFYIGISRDLCRRDLSSVKYAEMKLDCDFWLYR